MDINKERQSTQRKCVHKTAARRPSILWKLSDVKKCMEKQTIIM